MLVLLWASGSTGACRQVLGGDEYSVGDAPTADADAADAPILPALPDSQRDECETCALTKCGDLYSKCAASEPCKSVLACSSRCSDPNCLFVCKDSLPRSYDYEDYFACVFGAASPSPIQPRCRQECGAGQNWQCISRFFWSVREAPVTATVRLYDGTLSGPLSSYRAGVDIGRCDDGLRSTTEPPTGGDMSCTWEGKTDPYGTVSLELPASPDPSVVLAVRGSDEFQRAYVRPMSHSGFLDVFLVRLPLVSYMASCCTQAFDPNLGSVWFNTVDCLGLPAAVQVELSSPAFPARTLGTGEYGEYAVRPGEADPTAPSGVAGFFYNVPESQVVTLTGKLPVSGQAASRRTVMVAGGWVTPVWLFPIAANEPSE